MDTSIWIWLGFAAFTLALLAFDLGVVHRKNHVPSLREAIGLSLFYIALALTFGAGVFWVRGEEAGTAFLTGYLIEKALSVDNIFVFAVIFGAFAVPPALQYRVLFWGVLGALVMRLLLIAAGATLIAEFHWIIYILGAFLIFTGVKMWTAGPAEEDFEQNRILRWTRAILPVADGPHTGKFVVRRAGALLATPLLLVLILVEVTDLIFALDSIPAIFAVTTDPFIVYTSNVFAILGLRVLYFALAGVMDKFYALKQGLALLLVFIGGKMLINGVYGEHAIPTEWALLITALLIFGSIGFSLAFPKRVPIGHSAPSISL